MGKSGLGTPWQVHSRKFSQGHLVLFARCTDWYSNTACFPPARSLQAQQTKPPKPRFLRPEKEPAAGDSSPECQGRPAPGALASGKRELWPRRTPASLGHQLPEAPPGLWLSRRPLCTEHHPAGLWFLSSCICLDFQFGTHFALLRMLESSNISSASLKYSSQTISHTLGKGPGAD